MRYEVILFGGLPWCHQKNFTELCPNVDFPGGFRITGGDRKFVVLKGKKEIVVVIGPRLGDGSYLHKDLLIAAKRNIDDAEISGGGKISFDSHDGKRWSAKFAGRSVDYGIFDSAILNEAARRAIRDAIMMNVLFEWQD